MFRQFPIFVVDCERSMFPRFNLKLYRVLSRPALEMKALEAGV